jgi:Protein of unknown function (DUF2971)
VRVYRYYKSEHCLSVLKDLRIRASIPNSLNDPFELSPNIDPAQFTQNKCETFLRQDHEIDHWYQREGSQCGFTNKKAFKRWYLKDLPRRAAKLLPQVPQNIEQVRKNFANDFSEAWRIICCSLVRDSILMWSHYADNHAGLVLELETNEAPFSSVSEYILTVKYSEKKPEFIYAHKYGAFVKAYLPVAATKAIDWAYEKEIRIVLPRQPLKDGQYVPISPACIKGVYLGCRSSLETKKLVCSALRNPQFQNVKLAKTEVNPSKCELIFAEVV